LQQQEYIRYEDLPLEIADGRKFYVEFVSNVYQVDHHKVIQCNIRDITERKRAEDALRESEDKFKYVFEYSMVGKSITQFDGGMQVNQALCDLLGYSIQEMQAKKWQEITHPDDIELTQKEIEMLLSGEKESVRFVKRFIHKNGAIVWVDLSSTIRRDGQNKPLYLMSAVIDITERKRAEDALKENERAKTELLEKLNEAQHLALIGSWEWDLLTNQVWWSDETYRIFGVTPQDFVPSFEANGKFIHPDDFEKYSQAFEYSLQTGAPLALDLRLVNGDGLLKFCHAMGKIIYNNAGQALRFTGTLMDITKRKQAEAAQRQSELLFRSLFELSPDAVVILDPHDPKIPSSIVDCNAAACLMNGYQRDELIGQPIDIVNADPYTPDGQITYLKKLREAGHLKLEVLHRHKSGDIFPVEVSTTIIKVGEHELVLGIDRDITERKRAEQELKAYSERLEARVEERTRELREAQEKLVRQERLAMLGQLAGSVSHELRNPLGVISNAVYFLDMAQPEAAPKVKEYLGIIEKETRIADKIITDLLNFSRIKSADLESVSVAGLVQGVLERYPVPESVSVTVKIPKNLPSVYVDPDQLTQVLGNLVVNACQAMPKGGQLSVISKQLPLNTDPLMTEYWLLITIKDTGAGIPPENMSKLFEPLFSTKAKGIGLGLAICKNLVVANGGRIEVQSEVGKGSTFTVYLPVHRVAPVSARGKETI
jgi:PAS domain S-box-containing protein